MVENLKLNSDLCVEAGGIIFETDDDNVSIFPLLIQTNVTVWKQQFQQNVAEKKKHCVL